MLLQPHEIYTIKKSVKEKMKKTLKTWNYEIGGIVIKNRSANFADDSAEIIKEEGTLEIFLNCKSTFFIPQKKILVGKIEEFNSSFIQLSIFGIFKAFIYKKDISKEKLKFSNFKWKDSKKDVYLEKDALLQFSCYRFEVKDNFITFFGTVDDCKENGLYYEIEEDFQIDSDEFVKVENRLEKLYS